MAQKIDIVGGGKGGTVVLITGTLFIGYLYFTRRLPNVLRAIKNPGDPFKPVGTVPASMGSPPPTGGGAGGIPTNDPIIQVKIQYPAQYHLIDETLTVPASLCRGAVYNLVLVRTGSAATASAISSSACP